MPKKLIELVLNVLFSQGGLRRTVNGKMMLFTQGFTTDLVNLGLTSKEVEEVVNYVLTIQDGMQLQLNILRILNSSENK